MKKLLMMIGAAAVAVGANANGTWKDGASGNLQDAENWASGSLSGDVTFANSTANVSFLTNTNTSTTWIGVSRYYFNKGNFDLICRKSPGTWGGISCNNILVGCVDEGCFASLAKRENSLTATWGMQLGVVKNSTVAFTNVNGDVTIANATSDGNRLTVVAEGESSTASFVTLGGSCRFRNSITLGKGGGSNGRFEQNGGNVYIDGILNIGWSGSASYIVNSGTTTVTNKTVFGANWVDANDDLNLVLNGGTFETPSLLYHYGVRAATVLLDGGTLKVSNNALSQYNFTWHEAGAENAKEANTRAYLAFKVGAKGGTINLNGRDIVFHSVIASENGTSDGGITVTGGGSILLNAVSTFTGGLTVDGATTLAVNPGMKPGAGAVYVGSSAILKVPQSGVVDLSVNALTLNDGATLAFNFTDRETVPTLTLNAASTLPSTINVKVTTSVTDMKLKAFSRYLLATGCNLTGKTVNVIDKPEWVASVVVNGDGNLELIPKGKGLIISFH